MVTYAQIQRQRPGRITVLATVCLLFGTPFFVMGLFGVVTMMKQGQVRLGLTFVLLFCVTGAVAFVTGLGLLAMKRWARIAGVVACALGTISQLQGLPEIFRERSTVNIVLNLAILCALVWIGYFLLQPSTRELFVQAQGSDERVLKI